MRSNRMGILSLVAGGFVAGLALTAVQGCDDGGSGGPLGDIAEQCGLTCDADAFINGKASISGVPSIDAFFGATLDFTGAVGTVTADLRAEITALHALVGADASVEGDFAAKLDAKLNAYISGSLTVDAQPPRCEASVDIAVKAAAECDADVKPGEVSARCEGSCTIAADAQADCAAAGALTCRGTAPDLQCEGSCSGGCKLEVAAACDGTCRGSCDGMDMEGRCTGMCQGECDVAAGARCEGSCTGQCEYKPAEGSCDATAEAHCDASVHAEAKCEGKCEGKATPPEVSAECKASVDAKAEASVQCYPPSLALSYDLKAGLDAQADAEFRAFITNFRLRFSALLAASARAKSLIEVGGTLGAAGVAAVEGAATDLKASGDLKASIGAACAIGMLPQAATMITDSVAGLSAQAQAAASVTAAVGM